MIRRVADIRSKNSATRQITHLELWSRMEKWRWFEQNAPWIDLTLYTGLCAVRCQVRTTRFLSAERRILLEGVHSIVEMPLPSTARQILEVEQPEASYSHEVWLIWPNDVVWTMGQLKKRPKYHDKLVGYSHGLTEIKGKVFGPDDIVILDDNRFVGCEFDQCSVEFFGGETDLEDCTFNSPNLIVADAAANTVQVLNSLKALSPEKFSVLPEQ